MSIFDFEDILLRSNNSASLTTPRTPIQRYNGLNTLHTRMTTPNVGMPACSNKQQHCEGENDNEKKGVPTAPWRVPAFQGCSYDIWVDGINLSSCELRINTNLSAGLVLVASSPIQPTTANEVGSVRNGCAEGGIGRA